MFNKNGVINQIWCKIKKERRKEVWKGVGGATMCHNILLPSKVPIEWRNIPFKTKILNKLDQSSCIKAAQVVPLPSLV